MCAWGEAREENNGTHANVEWIRINTPKVAQGVIPLEQINIRVNVMWCGVV
jgi:hypothetical protein